VEIAFIPPKEVFTFKKHADYPYSPRKDSQMKFPIINESAVDDLFKTSSNQLNRPEI